MHDSGTTTFTFETMGLRPNPGLELRSDVESSGRHQPKKMPRYLHGKQESSDFDISIHKAECNKDVLHLADEDSVRQAEGKLRLTQAHINSLDVRLHPSRLASLMSNPRFGF